MQKHVMEIIRESCEIRTQVAHKRTASKYADLVEQCKEKGTGNFVQNKGWSQTISMEDLLRDLGDQGGVRKQQR